MKKKIPNRIGTNNIRTIRKSFPRFVSLMVMSLLGVFVFAGLMATEPDMVITIDNYLDDQNGYDISVISTLGLMKEDVEAIKALDSVEDAAGGKSLDLILQNATEEPVIQCNTVTPGINDLIINEGRLPEKSGEIAVEPGLLNDLGFQIGDTLEFESSSLKNQKFEIVGTVTSPLYYGSQSWGNDRGETSIGDGTVSFYAYLCEDDLDLDYYTVLYVTVNGTKELVTSHDDYNALVEDAIDEIKAIRSEREQARYDRILEIANKKIDDEEKDAYKQLDDQWAELEPELEKLVNGKNELDSAESELKSSLVELGSAREELDAASAQIAAGEAQLAAGKAQLDEAAPLLETAQTGLSAAEAGLSVARTALDSAQAAYDTAVSEESSQEEAHAAELQVAQSALDAANSAVAALQDQIASLDETADEETRASLEAALEEAQAAQSEAQSNYDSLASGTGTFNAEEAKQALDQAEAAYSEAEATYQYFLDMYNSAEAEYEAGVAAYNEGEAQLEAGKTAYAEGEYGYTVGLKEYEKGLEEYKSGQEEYEEGLQKYKDAVSDIKVIDLNREYSSMEEAQEVYQEAKADIASQVQEARDKLKDVEHPSWYIYDRTGYAEYDDYINDALSIKNLANIFPVIFFAVAVLVSLISMNRMVEEDRGEIGTLKSLGFDNEHIRSKYLVFSLAATIVGGIIGACTGMIILPKLIYNIYGLLFELPPVVLTLQLDTTLLGFGITVLCVCGTSVYTAQKVLREGPSELMRPKAPKNGKRILLERIPWLWGKLSFSQKVTIRNLFRYKKRVLVTIGGIIGCTALMLTGFGIKDSIATLPQAQFEDLYHFSGLAYVTQFNREDFLSQSEIAEIYPMQRISTTSEGQKYVYLSVVEDAESLSSIVTLRDANTKEELTLEDGTVIVTEKFAKTAGLQVGDSVTIVDVDNNSYEFIISGIVDNYVYHYVYVTKATYESLGHSFAPSLVYFNTNEELTKEQQNQLAKNLTSTGNVFGLWFNDSLVKSLSDTLDSLNSVVYILLVLSAMLSFVVLFNLSNINICERQREIATLKVLGFYDREVDAYITRETVILTIVGIAFGLLLGTFVSRMVVSNVEINYCRFINQLQLISYLFSAAFAVLFTLIVNGITHFNLKRIDMIDSLKSVE